MYIPSFSPVSVIFPSNPVISDFILFEEYLKPGWSHTLASHGYLPFQNETTTFIACGKNIKQGVVVERGSMLNEASTMAAMLGMEMNDTEGTPWTEILK